jgi:surface protein
LPANNIVTLSINPSNFKQINISNGVDKNRLIDVTQWGSVAWTGMQYAFQGCSNLQISASDVPNLSNVINMRAMFYDCSVLNSPANINTWNTTNVTNMSYMFTGATAFNQPIGDWNTANVINMNAMFSGASVFNRPIGSWNTIKVTNMSFMFQNALSFNQPIGNWNTPNVTNMGYMFYNTTAFNQPIGNWNTTNVTNMSWMFNTASVFNQPVGNWNTPNVTDMSYMFTGATSFNQPIVNWNTAKVTSMSNMFSWTSAFNQPIGAWNTANVTDMSWMFANASVFNQPIGTWNTANVTDMSYMLGYAPSFNQNLGTWNLKTGVNLSYILDNNGMDCSHYSSSLKGWATNPSAPNGLSLGAANLAYGINAVTDRTTLTTTKGWTIAGDIAGAYTCTACPSTTIWNGSWSNGTPTASSQIIFNADYTLTSDLSGCSCQINAYKNITVPGTNTLTLANELIVGGTSTIRFENNSSLLQTNNGAINTGNIVYKRNAQPMLRYDYTYWSSPVAGQTLGTPVTGLSPDTLLDKYFSYDAQTTDNWLQIPASTTMLAGKGYIVRAPQTFNTTSPTTVFNASFTGVPNNGIKTTPIYGTNRNNLIGNPYPSAIDANAFLSLNNTVVKGTIYLWTHNTAPTSSVYTNNDYAAYIY